jgi:hypothetical protein
MHTYIHTYIHAYIHTYLELVVGLPYVEPAVGYVVFGAPRAGESVLKESNRVGE